jgi:catechol 2,3-dioxygenase-like lactoylglutathione lyase family enzyme
MLTGLAHVDLVCRDIDASVAFYRAVLGPLGLGSTTFEPAGERGETIHYLRFPTEGTGSIGLRGGGDEQEFLLYGPGLHHLALAVETPADVRLAHERAVAAGAEVLHAPRAFPAYHPDYFATFFLDPDGFRVEVRSR